ncbi:hypothetical protein SSX86_016513 [Deinandra increscens subsp. villosa]|uniref:Stomatal closure-related actin-binding protein 1 n=1 Tax=Deinandra increscens subsp. villosa TaxID=3103831 RepID=A0AAP0H047_9ASTR
MTRLGRDFSYTTQRDAVSPVSADVIFASTRFPNYKCRANNNTLEDTKLVSIKDDFRKETAQLLDQQNRLSVRDLASKFENGLAAAAKLSDETKLQDVASLEKHVLLHNLRDALESLRGRAVGKNKDDVEEAIAMVESLAFQLTQRESELVQENAEVKKLASFLKQASEDAKKLVDEERAFARTEIEKARTAVQRVEEALQEQERMSRATGKQDVEELMKEVLEARRIKMLHQPSKITFSRLETSNRRTSLYRRHGTAEHRRYTTNQRRPLRRLCRRTAAAGQPRFHQASTPLPNHHSAAVHRRGSAALRRCLNHVRDCTAPRGTRKGDSTNFAVREGSRPLPSPTTLSAPPPLPLPPPRTGDELTRRFESIVSFASNDSLHLGVSNGCLNPTKVMDMDHELHALRAQLVEKSKSSLKLQKELAMSKRGEKNAPKFFELGGTEALGSYLEIHPCSGKAPELLECSIQWYRLISEDGKKHLISGATKPIYAPEPSDVGRVLQAEINSDSHSIMLTTTGPIDPAAGLGNYVEALVRRHETEFNVVIVQMNGADHPSESIHVLHVGKMRMKLCKDKTTVAKEYYSSFMQLCGVRGGGNAAAQASFWQPKIGLSFVLAFESERERNAAIMLARRFAFDCNIMLTGPDDRAAQKTT